MTRTCCFPILVIAVVAIVAASCSKDDPSINTVSPATEPLEVELSFGESVQLSNGLVVSFEDVTHDSRCPSDAICFWPGMSQMMIKVTTTGNDPVDIFPAKINGDEHSSKQLAGFAFGFRIELVGISPYPATSQIPQKEDYVINLLIGSNDSYTYIPKVIATDTSPSELTLDPFDLAELEMQADTLSIRLFYSGGCNEHDFDLYWSPPTFMESEPVQVNLIIRHEDYDDACEAYLSRWLKFDLTPIRESYIGSYSPTGKVILNVYDYFEETPSEKLTILYEIE